MKIFKGIGFAPQGGTPTNPTNGDVYYDSSIHKLRVYQNGAWVNLSDTDGTVLLADGSAGSPSLAFTNDTNTGLFLQAADAIGISLGGSEEYRFTSVALSPGTANGSSLGTGSLPFLEAIVTTYYAGNGSAALPSYSFSSDSNSGFYSNGSDNPAISVGGSINVDFQSTRDRFYVPIQAPDGTVTLPGVTFGEAGTGFSRDGSGSIQLGSTVSLARLVVGNNITNATSTIVLNSNGGGTGDQFITFAESSAGGFSLGRDDSDSGSFKISQQFAGLGTNDFFKISTTGIVTLGVSAGVQSHIINGFLDVSKTLGVTSSSSSGHGINIAGDAQLIGTEQTGIQISTRGSSGATNVIYAVSGSASTTAAAFTTSFLSQFIAQNPAKGAGSTITRQVQFYSTTPTQGTNNAGLADNASFTGSWFINSTSTNSSRLSGKLAIGSNPGTTDFLMVGNQSASANTILTGSTQNGIAVDFTASSAATTLVRGIRSFVRTENAVFTTPVVANFLADTISKGAASTITRSIQYELTGALTVGTNNAGISDNESFTGNYFINSTNTNPSLLAGSMVVGSTSSTVSGFEFNNGANLTSADQKGFYANFTSTSAATGSIRGVQVNIGTSATVYTSDQAIAFFANGISLGAGSTITRAISYFGANPTVGTNNANFADNVAFTGDWFINSTSTRASGFSGAFDLAQIATPSNPAASRNRLYFKSDGNLYKLSSAGTETVFATGAGSGDINNGGNTFGSAITIGTNDAFDLNLERNNVTSLTISVLGGLPYITSTGRINLDQSFAAGLSGAALGNVLAVIQAGNSNSTLTQTRQWGVYAAHTASSAATGAAGNPTVAAFVSGVTTAAAAFTAPVRAGLYHFNVTKGAGSTITRDIGVRLETPTQGTNNASIADNEAFTGDWFINQSGTADSTLGGGLLIAKRFANSSAFGGSAMLKLNGNTLTGVSQFAVEAATFTGTSAATSQVAGFLAGVTTAAAAFTTALRSNFYSQNITKGAGSTITRDVGYYVENPTEGANRASIADNVSFTGNYFINSASSNPSFISGRVGIGQTTGAGVGLTVGPASVLSGTTQEGINIVPNFQSDATATGYGIRSQASTVNATFTMSELIHFFASNTTKGAASTITRYSSFQAAVPTQGTNNALLTDTQNFAAGNWGLYVGSNPNYLGSRLGVGVLASPAYGIIVSDGGTISTGSSQRAFGTGMTVDSTATSDAVGFFSYVGTANASFTVAQRSAFWANNPAKGASSTITRDIQLLINGAMSGTNNAYIADNVSFTGNWFINQQTAKDSHFNTNGLFEILGNGSGSQLHDFFHNPAGADVLNRTYNFDNTSATSNAVIRAQVGGASAGDPKFTAVVDGGQTWAWGIDNSDSDSWVLSNSATLGSSNYIKAATAGNVTLGSNQAFNVDLGSASFGYSRSASGSAIRALIENLSNTADSGAALQLNVAGSSGGDPAVNFQIVSEQQFVIGIDNTDNNFKVSASSVLGSSDYLIVTNDAAVQMAAGTGDQAGLTGLVFSDVTERANVGTGEDDLGTYAMPAQTMRHNGDQLELEWSGTTAANANNKNFKVYLGTGSVDLTTGAVALNNKAWRIKASLKRTSSSIIKGYVEWFCDDQATSPFLIKYVERSVDYTTALTFKLTGEATADNDINNRTTSAWFSHSNP